jgi:two-component system LytT family response regulator
MKARCLIVDDEPLARKLLADHASKIESLEVMGACANAMEASHWLRSQKVELVFLDIQMPEINGLQFVQSLKNPPAIIFTTAHRNFAPEAFDLEALDYLLKPISFDRFLKSVHKFFDWLAIHQVPAQLARANEDAFIYIKSDRKTIKVALAEIRYIESLDDYVKVHTTNRVWITHENISTFADTLGESFIRIHRSFLIHTRFLTAFTNESVFLDKTELPFGRTFKRLALAQLQQAKG